LLSQLKGLQKKYPFIGHVRGIGPSGAIETHSRERRIIRNAFRPGLLLSPCGRKVIRLLPPPDASSRKTDMALEIQEEAFKEEVSSSPIYR